MIEILCTRLDMIILPGEAARSGGPGLLVDFEPRQSRSGYLKRNSKVVTCRSMDDSNPEGSPEAVEQPSVEQPSGGKTDQRMTGILPKPSSSKATRPPRSGNEV